jgi:hypothetical protein
VLRALDSAVKQRPAIDFASACAIGYFAKIPSIRLNAFSAAAYGVVPPCTMSVQPVPQTCAPQ